MITRNLRWLLLSLLCLALWLALAAGLVLGGVLPAAAGYQEGLGAFETRVPVGYLFGRYLVIRCFC